MSEETKTGETQPDAPPKVEEYGPPRLYDEAKGKKATGKCADCGRLWKFGQYNSCPICGGEINKI